MNFLRYLFAVLVIAAWGFTGNAQTYRGAINGTVSDPSGAIVPDAEVKARNKATDITTSTTTTSDGQFAFQDLPVGAHQVSVVAPGFPEMSVDNVLVTQGSIYTLPVKLSLSQQATTVEVSAAALSLDTTTETQTTTVTGDQLQDMPLNGRDFTQLQPDPGTFGNLPRNFLYGPGFASVDFSVIKNTKITERINAQFRVELYNLFNRINLAPPSGGFGSGGFGVSSDTIGDYNGAPGIGPGEAFNVQLGLKITF